jgi:hypothetical protein
MTEATNILPMLRWRRTITWWPKHDWDRYGKTTLGDDLSPADEGNKLKQIEDRASLGDNEEGANTIIDVTYSPYICDECPQTCGFSITHNANVEGEDWVAEEGFKTIDEAKAAAEAVLVRILKGDALRDFAKEQDQAASKRPLPKA